MLVVGLHDKGGGKGERNSSLMLIKKQSSGERWCFGELYVYKKVDQLNRDTFASRFGEPGKTQ